MVSCRLWFKSFNPGKETESPTHVIWWNKNAPKCIRDGTRYPYCGLSAKSNLQPNSILGINSTPYIKGK